MTQFTAYFENADATETTTRQFQLADFGMAQAWFSAVTEAVTHISSAGSPTDARKLRQWKIIRYHINQANDDHLLDEWIHFPLDIVDNFQPLLNSVRLRAHAFELYAAANLQQSPTRTSLLRVIQAIDAFEATVDPAGYQSYLRFQHDTVEFDEKYKCNSTQAGDIVLVQPPPQRTAYQMYRANDLTLLDKRLLKPWTDTFSNYSMIVLNDNKRNIDTDTMPLCKDNYVLNNTVAVASVIDQSGMEAISTLKIARIQA
jgi:hypothetical protein